MTDHRRVWIESRPNGKQLLRWIDPAGKRKSLIFKGSAAAAERQRRTLERKINQGQEPAGRATIKTLLQLLEENISHNISAEYWRNLKRALAVMAEYCGRNLNNISRLSIDRMKTARLAAGLSPATIRTEITHCKAALKYAVSWGLISDNPFSDVKLGKTISRKKNILTATEEKALYKTATRILDTCLIHAALDGGLRAKEISCLNILEDYDRQTGKLYVRHRLGLFVKTGRERTVLVLPAHRIDFHRLQIQSKKKGKLYPFYNGSGNQVSRRFIALRDQAGVKVSLQDLRATCETRLYQRGINPNIITEYMGHTQAVMRDHYLTISGDAIISALEGSYEAL